MTLSFEHIQSLKECLAKVSQQCYPMHSRVHPLRSFSFPSTCCVVKRDDELGFGISGSKIRKYRSLISALLAKKTKEVIVIGSAYSNHVLSFIQLLIENGLKPTLFLRGDSQRPLCGNALLTSLFISPSSVHWFSKENWKHAVSEAHLYANQQKHATFVLPEGGFCLEALPGALTLVLDLLENEHSSNLTFDHIFLEAGTGFTASALILGLNWIQHPACIHLLLLAEDQKTFLHRLHQTYEMFNQLIGNFSPFPQNFILHKPHLTGKFGKISSSLFDEIITLARQEGFLTDPIYSAKLFMETKNLLAQGNIQGNVLIHHAGGALTLTGFQDPLRKSIAKCHLI